MSNEGIPTLRQFLGDGSRGADFEDFQNHVRELMTAYPDVTGERRRLVRFMQAVSIAVVEVARQETTASTADEVVEIMGCMIIGGATAIAGAALSVLSDDVPADMFREHMMAFFRAGAEEVIRSNGLK